MKKRIVMFGLSICLFAASCNGAGSQEDSGKDAKEPPKASAQEDESQDITANDEEAEETVSKDQEHDPPKEQKESEPEEAQPSDEKESSETLGQALSQTPEVTFVDYSQDIKDEKTGALLLNVTENCPVISIPENELAAEKMNMVFEQQHVTNQAYIEEDTETARTAYQALSKEEAAGWGGYGYGVSYKVVYASPKILSIEAESYKWQGNAHPNIWTSTYCFDAATGTLLYLSDVFSDKAEAGRIVEKAILDTITKEPYKDALMPDYESYVPDVLTENVFYLNEKGLVVICNPDMVTVYAAGVIEVEVPYEELKTVMNPNFIVE